jgi:hypothetical protein
VTHVGRQISADGGGDTSRVEVRIWNGQGAMPARCSRV